MTAVPHPATGPLTARRMTLNRAAVLRFLLRHPEEATWSYQVARQTHVENGLVGRFLSQLEADGYATSWWAGRDRTADGPRRHWYQLTAAGRALRAEVLAFLARYATPAARAEADPDVLAAARDEDP